MFGLASDGSLVNHHVGLPSDGGYSSHGMAPSGTFDSYQQHGLPLADDDGWINRTFKRSRSAYRSKHKLIQVTVVFSFLCLH